MLNKIHSKTSFELTKKMMSLEFVLNTQVDSVNKITSGNFNNTFEYNKNLKKYLANINYCGNNFKVLIKVKGDKPNPKYERKLKKLF